MFIGNEEETGEKLGWSQQIISNDLAELTKNGKSAENGKPDPLRFADVWSFVECDKYHRREAGLYFRHGYVPKKVN